MLCPAALPAAQAGLQADAGCPRPAPAHLLDHAARRLAVPVESQLRDPLEVVGRGAAALAELLNHVARVDLDGDQRHYLRGCVGGGDGLSRHGCRWRALR